MPPREVFCDLCGGKFFAHSLPHHRKSCEKKVQSQMHECPYCAVAVTQLEMDSHILSCKVAKAAGAKPTGQSAQLRQRLQQDRRGTATAASGRLISQTSSQGARCGREVPLNEISGRRTPMDQHGAGADSVLLPCQVCGRTFSADRIAKHQAICLKVSKKRPIFRAEKQRVFMEGGSGGSVAGTAMSTSHSRYRGSSKAAKAAKACDSGLPLNTRWREQSKSFREAIRAAKGAPPMPIWGHNGHNQRSQPARGSFRQRSMPRAFNAKEHQGASNRSASRPTRPASDAAHDAVHDRSKATPLKSGSSTTGLRGSPGGSAIGLGMSKAARQHAAAWEGNDPFGGPRSASGLAQVAQRSNSVSAENPLAALARCRAR